MSSEGGKLLSELKSMCGFLDAQKKLLSPEAFANMRDNQVKFFELRLDQVGSLTFDEASSLSSSFGDGPWTSVQKETFARKLSECANTHAAKKGRRPLQTLKGFSLYLTLSEKTLLQGDAHNLVKLDAVINRCFLIGLHLPSESCSGHVVATAIDYGMKAPTPSDKHSILKAFKQGLKSKVKHAPQCAIHLVTFPPLPTDLPDVIFKEAYAEEKPHMEDCEGKGVQDVPKRKTHKTVRQNPMGMAGQLGQCSPQEFMMQLCQNLAAARFGQSGEDPFNFQIFKNQKRQKALEQPTGSPSTQRDDSQPKEVLAIENGKNLPVKGSPSEEKKKHDNGNLFDLEMVQPPESSNKKADENAQTMADAFQQREEKKQNDGDHKVTPVKGKAKAKATAKTKVKADKGSTKSKTTTKVSGAKSKKPSPPKAGEGTLFYGSGKIHRSDKSSCWRVFINKSDKIDKKVYWKGSEADSFKKALDMIDAGK